MARVKKRLVLGITGGVASGKSTVMRILADAGIPTLSSDDLAHAAIMKGKPLYRRLLKRYGRHLLRTSEQICRSDLGKIVFKDAAERKWLEKQIHPIVVRELQRFIRRHSGFMTLDIPLLFEARLQKLVDKTVVIYCSPAQQLQRLMRRNGYSEEAAMMRIEAQMPISEKRQRADIVILNTGTLRDLKEQVQKKLLTSKLIQV